MRQSRSCFRRDSDMRTHALKLVSLLSLAMAVALFVPQRAAADQDDPPGRVARLSYTHGSVSFNPAGTDDWVNTVVNRPITTGDKLWTDNGARAELHIGSAAIRLSDNTGFSFLNLDDRMAQIRLTEGTLNVRVRRLEQDETFEVDTPNLAFSILRPGNYKINVNEAGDATVVVVHDGEGEVTGGGSAYAIHPRETGTFSGADQLDADIQRFGDNDDDFDHWCGDRDRREDRSQSSRYVSSDVIGYEDLDDNGGWRPVPEYGTVWFPRTTVAGWAPYRYGHWVWVSPWGWTWVDDAPWGFAPFHYGRWVTVGGVWGWVPSPPRPAVVTVAYVRPVYAPALVAWVGGSHFGVGVAVGGAPSGVAWFPLGPRDVYCPSYHVSPRYVERVNVSNTVIVNRTQVTNVYNNVYVNKTTNVTNITYQNQRANNAVTATSQASFTSAQPVGRNMVRVNEREVASAPVAPMTNVAPQQRSFSGATGPARARPPANVVARPAVAQSTPPPPPASAAKQVQAVQANGGRPPAVSRIREAQPEAANPNVKIAAAAKPAPLPARGNRPAPNTNQPGARPNANQPPAQPNANQPATNQPATRPNPNQPPERPNSNRPEERANPNRPPSANNPKEPNVNRANPSQPTPNQPAARPNPNQPAEKPKPNRPEERPTPNRPPAANTPNEPNPNANRPANRPPNDRPSAAPPTVDRQAEQRQQQQQLEKQRQQEQQQQRMEQQRANEQRQQQMQKQQQQQQQKPQQNERKEVQKQQPPPKQQENAKPQPPKKENKENKENKDRPPSR